MISVFDKLLRSHPDLDYLILGNFNEEINDEILSGYSEHTRQRISFKPFDTDIAKYLGKALLYLQLSRYEAFGIAVTEAAFAGIPVFVSDQVGARVMFNDYDKRNDFIIENENDGDAVKKILAFMDLPVQSKMEISTLVRKMAQPYSQKRAVQNYKSTFETALGLNI
jgi:glycosyltransferase involved in cell wall biosynthesis